MTEQEIKNLVKRIKKNLAKVDDLPFHIDNAGTVIKDIINDSACLIKIIENQNQQHVHKCAKCGEFTCVAHGDHEGRCSVTEGTFRVWLPQLDSESARFFLKKMNGRILRG